MQHVDSRPQPSVRHAALTVLTLWQREITRFCRQRSRWGSALRDELMVYGDDGLINVDSGEIYPLTVEADPALGMLIAPGDRDALIEPKDDIHFADPDKVRRIHFEGENFKCAGPLNATPSPQGRPVIVQAGASDRGREFASRHAELIICSKESLDEMKFICDDIRNRAVKHGRKEADVKILFTFNPMVIGATEEAAARKNRLFEEVGMKLVEAGLAKVSRSLGMVQTALALAMRSSPASTRSLMRS